MSRPHQIIPDPTGEYVLVPDLGADVVRIFRVSRDPVTRNRLIEQPPLQFRSGSGPRHGTFVEISGGMFFYVINQSANTLVTFSVSYLGNKSLVFKALAEMDLLVRMNGTRVDRDVKASHLQISV